jgi:hypothetical protein
VNIRLPKAPAGLSIVESCTYLQVDAEVVVNYYWASERCRAVVSPAST